MSDAPSLGLWKARTLRRARLRDVMWLLLVCLLGWGSLWSGNRARRHLSPDGSRAAAAALDDLELPGALPNVELAGDTGQVVRLFDLLDRPATVVSVYAHWCAPCQKELPVLTGESKDRLVVVVGGDEDLKKTRQGLINLGLKDLHYFVDTSGRLFEQGRVSSLPTTFLLGRKGRVRDRVVGYSEFRLRMLLTRSRIGDG